MLSTDEWLMIQSRSRLWCCDAAAAAAGWAGQLCLQLPWVSSMPHKLLKPVSCELLELHCLANFFSTCLPHPYTQNYPAARTVTCCWSLKPHLPASPATPRLTFLETTQKYLSTTWLAYSMWLKVLTPVVRPCKNSGSSLQVPYRWAAWSSCQLSRGANWFQILRPLHQHKTDICKPSRVFQLQVLKKKKSSSHQVLGKMV